MFNFFKKQNRQTPADLKKVVLRLASLENKLEETQRELRELIKDNKFNIQKVGVVRFNPFKEVGGNQSFSVALLDGENSGIVVTSLFLREGNRVFGKAVKESRSEYQLSEEEKQAIDRAQNPAPGPGN